MAVLDASEIYQFARAAGFSPDQAVTMTAIALAESGGNTGAHNSTGEDSRGLWQINLDAHGSAMAHLDLTNPADQATAAFMVSRNGQDISPWTVTHANKKARYLGFREQAEAAATFNGEGGAVGQWNPPDGYGDRTPAAPDGANTPGSPDLVAPPDLPDAPLAPPPVAGAPGPVPAFDQAELSTPGGPSVESFLEMALAQDGKPYVLGAEADGVADPRAFDCSELVQWASQQIGLDDMRDGTFNQYLWLKEQGMIIPVEEAANIPGALLYRFDHEPSPDEAYFMGHVAISLGDGTTIEARGKDWGTGQWDVGNRFQYAALIPGLDYSQVSDLDPAAFADRALTLSENLKLPPDEGPDVDLDRDLLGDRFEARIGLDPEDNDTDGDGITDGYELIQLGTDALNPDSDYDGLTDDVELGLGLDPNVADNPDSDADALPIAQWVDADGDGIVDWYEDVMDGGQRLAEVDDDDGADDDFDETPFGDGGFDDGGLDDSGLDDGGLDDGIALFDGGVTS